MNLYHFKIHMELGRVNPEGYVLAHSEDLAISIFLANIEATGLGHYRRCKVNPVVKKELLPQWMALRVLYRVQAVNPRTYHDLILTRLRYAQ